MQTKRTPGDSFQEKRQASGRNMAWSGQTLERDGGAWPWEGAGAGAAACTGAWGPWAWGASTAPRPLGFAEGMRVKEWCSKLWGTNQMIKSNNNTNDNHNSLTGVPTEGPWASPPARACGGAAGGTWERRA